MAKGIPTSWVAALPESLSKSITAFTLIEQGRADTCFLSLDSGVELFAKQANENTVKTEVSVLKFLAQNSSGISFLCPDLYDINNKLLLTNKLCGESILSASNPFSLIDKLAQSLAEMHKLNAASVVANLAEFEMPKFEALANAFELIECESSIKEALLEKYITSQRTLAELPPHLGFIHGDLTPDNILITKNEQLILLDWEFASIRDIRWDLATICEEFEFTQSQTLQLITDYLARGKLDDPDFTSGLTAWRYVYLAVCFVWAVEEQHNSEFYFTRLQQSLSR